MTTRDFIDTDTLSTLLHRLGVLVVALVLGTAVACGPATETEEPIEEPLADEIVTADEPLEAFAVLRDAEGDEVGRVTFTEVEEGVQIEADITDASLAAGDYGFHVHETGECTPPDFTSAGGHFDPTGAEHGAPGPESHAGDYGNITLGEDGTGSAEYTTGELTLEAGPAMVVGRAVILHEGTDDLTSQPTGDAGARYACGIVELGEAGDDMDGPQADTESEPMADDTTSGDVPE